MSSRDRLVRTGGVGGAAGGAQRLPDRHIVGAAVADDNPRRPRPRCGPRSRHASEGDVLVVRTLAVVWITSSRSADARAVDIHDRPVRRRSLGRPGATGIARPVLRAATASDMKPIAPARRDVVPPPCRGRRRVPAPLRPAGSASRNLDPDPDDVLMVCEAGHISGPHGRSRRCRRRGQRTGREGDDDCHASNRSFHLPSRSEIDARRPP